MRKQNQYAKAILVGKTTGGHDLWLTKACVKCGRRLLAVSEDDNEPCLYHKK